MRILVVLVLLGGTAGCDLVGHDEAYPATLHSLSNAQLQKRVTQFREANDHEICSTLNKYGLTSADGCFYPDQIPDEGVTKTDAIAMAKQALVDNERYTNVGAASKLRVDNAISLSHPDEPKETEWKVAFKEQVWEGKIVRNTRISVWLTAEGVFRIGGHWYQNIVFPDDRISRSEALDSALGYEIVYSDWTGVDTLTVSEDNLPPPDEVKRSILPHEIDDTIQLRVVWEFTVADSFFRLYVDEGEARVLRADTLVDF